MTDAAPMRVGRQLPAVQLTVSPLVMFSRQWAGTNPVHWDPEVASRQGMDAPVATGQLSAALIQQSCVTLLGEAMFRGSVFEVRFRRPVHVNDVLTAGGAITEVSTQPQGVRVVVSAWCRNQDGVEVTTARVEALVRDGG
ncbi:MAG: MaoC family dehydratase [Dehalococcoidia bacterium]